LEEEKKRKSLKRFSERPGRILDKGRVLLWVPNPSSEKFQFSPPDTLYALAKVFPCCFTDCSKVFFSEFEA
jgi:hypothetical protein